MYPPKAGKTLQLSIVAAVVLRLVLIVLILVLVVLILVILVLVVLILFVLVLIVLVLVLVLILVVHCFISSLQICIRRTDLQVQYVQKEMKLYTFLKRISIKKMFCKQIQVRAKQQCRRQRA